jgi:hypothetical protein
MQITTIGLDIAKNVFQVHDINAAEKVVVTMELPVDANGQGTALSLSVVRTGLPRIAPCQPRLAISRSTVQRATVKPSRRNCRQTFRTP